MNLIFSDFDGTLTDHGQLGATFFELLKLMEKHGQRLVVVTGRSVSWGHFLMTHFPVEAVIAEGGGALVYRDENSHMQHTFFVTNDYMERLADVEELLLEQFPGVELTLDSLGRFTDRAIELKDITADQLQNIKEFLTAQKVDFQQSNVHLNFWTGGFNKKSGLEHTCQYVLKQWDFEAICNEGLFFGDSCNDQELFGCFEKSVGVSNVNEVLHLLTHKPKTILQGEDKREVHGVYHYLQNYLK